MRTWVLLASLGWASAVLWEAVKQAFVRSSSRRFSRELVLQKDQASGLGRRAEWVKYLLNNHEAQIPREHSGRRITVLTSSPI